MAQPKTLIHAKRLAAPFAIGLACALFPAPFAQAAPGELDTSYGLGTGKSLTNFGGSSDDLGNAVALQPDGKIIVAGGSNLNGSYDFAVARLLNPEGTIDPSYGGGTGKSLAGFGGYDIASAVALQPDGKIVLAGFSLSGSSNFAVARLLNPEGTFDSDYGGGSGRSLADFGGDDTATALALQPDGMIVVAGVSDGNFAVARLLNPQGTFDPSYGGGSGKSLVDFGGGSSHSHTAVALQPDGKIVVGGSSGGNFAVAQLLNPQGTLDPSFGGGTGKSLVDFGGNDTANAVALQPDGKIVLAGSSDGDFAVARLLDQGFDSSFGTIRGKSVVDFGATDTASAVALQPDGKIVLAGSSNANGNNDFAVARLQGDPGGVSAANSKCAGKKATIVGTNGKDKLKGTKKRDVISAGKGKDTVKGLGGNDLICGGKGKDKLLGGPGKDKLLGGPGKDKLIGGPGKDKLNGGAGKDSVKQ
jgi:uncharacterized delta-60 repeat protein